MTGPDSPVATVSRRVAILGAGGIAFGYAAFLRQQGHEVTLWSPSGHGTAALANGADLRASGAVVGGWKVRVASTCAEALSSAQLVIVALPAYGHRTVIDAMAPHVENGQVVVFSAHLSLAAQVLRRALSARGVAAPVAALGTTVLTARKSEPDAVRIGTVRQKVDIAVLPVEATGDVVAQCCDLFGDRFEATPDLLSVALANLNPQNHLAIALCNLTRMELGETWRQASHITPAVCRLIEALDAERLALAAAFGIQVRTVHQHIHLSYGVSIGSLAEMEHELAQRPGGVNGPATLDTRYVTEDVPFGLVPTLELAALMGVPMPLHEAGVRTMSALYGRNFAGENDLLPALGRLSREILIG